MLQKFGTVDYKNKILVQSFDEKWPAVKAGKCLKFLADSLYVFCHTLIERNQETAPSKNQILSFSSFKCFISNHSIHKHNFSL